MTRIAAIQLNASADVIANLNQATTLIEQAASQGARLVALPEMFTLIGQHPEDKLQVKEELGSGPIQQFLAHQAREHNIWLLGGTIALAAPNSAKAFAASLLFDNQGELVAHYNKMHLFDVALSNHLIYEESATIVPGNKIVVVDTPIGKLGLSVCYDLRFPELYREMSAQGATVFIIPSAFTFTTGQAHWEPLLRARAIENFAYVLAPNQVGVHANQLRSYGHSMIIDPWGMVLANAQMQEPAVIIADIDLHYVQECRNRIPALERRVVKK